jgi:hypothetical protein
LREYGLGAQILRYVGVRKMRLLTNNPKKIAGLGGYGLELVDQVPLFTAPNPANTKYLKTKREKLGHHARAVRGRGSGRALSEFASAFAFARPRFGSARSRSKNSRAGHRAPRSNGRGNWHRTRSSFARRALVPIRDLVARSRRIALCSLTASLAALASAQTDVVGVGFETFDSRLYDETFAR